MILMESSALGTNKKRPPLSFWGYIKKVVLSRQKKGHAIIMMVRMLFICNG